MNFLPIMQLDWEVVILRFLPKQDRSLMFATDSCLCFGVLEGKKNIIIFFLFFFEILLKKYRTPVQIQAGSKMTF